jgi:cytochrome c oxidase assembly protein subunit 11
MTIPGRHRRSNGRLAAILAAVAVAMVGMAFAAVPAYRAFCQVTGYGGTPSIVTGAGAETAASAAGGRRVTIRFDASTDGRMPWGFRPEQEAVTARLGERKLIHYRAVNPTDQTITGTATFNVTPLKAAQYLSKIDCFCFTEQTLAPGESADMPVLFYIDPAMAEDDTVAEVDTLTLSYTFFRKDGGGGEEGRGAGPGS